jgi:hypothetical protein
MLIIGCDFHTRYQQIAMAREETSELAGGATLTHQADFDFCFFRGWPTLCVFFCKGWATPGLSVLSSR